MGQVLEIAYLGGRSIYRIKLDNGAVVKAAAVHDERPASLAVAVGDRVALSFDPESGIVLLQ